MHKQCFLFNYRMLTPLISCFPPATAYGIARYTGGIGKALDKHSFRFDKQTLSEGVRALTEYMKMDAEDAEKIINKFFLIEARVLLEHIWLAKCKLKHLHQMIDMNAMRKLSKTLDENGPMLLLSAHTVYYYIIPWALYKLGNKIAYVMADPRSDVSSQHILSGISSINALSRLMPIVFTNEGDTIKKTTALLKEGYTVLMLIDIPGYKGKGVKVSFLNRDIWVPSGCKWIFEGASSHVGAVFSYVKDIRSPYNIQFTFGLSNSGEINLQKWADKLEDVVRLSPESWLGWFYLKDMG